LSRSEMDIEDRQFMKKYIYCVVASLMILTFPGCSSDKSDETISAPPVVINSFAESDLSNTPVVSSSANVAGTTPSSMDSNMNDFSLGTTTLSEQEIYQDDDLTLTAKSGLSLDIETGLVIIPIQVQNNSSERIELLGVDGSVNGAMIQTIFFASAEPGVKTDASLYLPINELNYAGIDLLDDLESYLMLTHSKDESVVFTESPLVIEFEGNGNYSQVFDRSGTVVLDQDGIVTTVRPYPDSSGDLESDYNILVMVENNSSDAVRISLSSVKVNGESVPSLFYSQVLSGKVSFKLCTFFEEDLSAANISEVLTVEFVIAIEDPISNEDLFVSEPITISVV